MMNCLRCISAAAIFLTLTACSTFNGINPFANNKPEDYNALTYGSDYENGRARDGVWASTQDDSRSTYRSVTDVTDPASRSIASTDHKKDSYYNDDKQDPTDEKVRQQIEARRNGSVSAAQANANFVRGDRATRSDFYDNTPNDGSLWANENDANYFFTKGKVRTMGDIISVKLEDALIKQFAEEIKKSLTPAEQEVEMALYRKNEVGAKDDADLKAYRNIASEDLKSSEAEDVKNRMEKSVRWSQVDLTKVIGFAPNEELRAEIIDRYQNGNFKIRAVKRVLYRGSSKMVSLVAVAPTADFDDKDLITSGKLYEYKIRVAH